MQSMYAAGCTWPSTCKFYKLLDGEGGEEEAGKKGGGDDGAVGPKPPHVLRASGLLYALLHPLLGRRGALLGEQNNLLTCTVFCHSR